MGQTSSWHVAAGLTITAVVLSAVVGCSVPGTVASRSTLTSLSPTAACPVAGTEPRTDSTCAQYDGEAAMAANETYRQRRKLTPEMRAQLDAYVGPARKALDSLTRPPNADDVEMAFTALSLKEVQTDDGGNGVRFGVTVPIGGCLYGYVPLTGPATVETGGGIMDGGCLDMVGH
ncbi:hypothetical protein ABIE18_003644 [Arthrobacter sp. 2762]